MKTEKASLENRHEDFFVFSSFSPFYLIPFYSPFLKTMATDDTRLERWTRGQQLPAIFGRFDLQ
jgi:hypothetical protein